MRIRLALRRPVVSGLVIIAVVVLVGTALDLALGGAPRLVLGAVCFASGIASGTFLNWWARKGLHEHGTAQ